MLKGLKDRIVNISSSATGMTVPGVGTSNSYSYRSKSKTKSKLKKIVIASLAVATIALTTIAGIGASMTKTLTIYDGTGAGKEITTTERYVEDILAAEGITLGEKDSMNVLAKTPLEDDMKIEITRAYKVTVTDRGVTKEYMTLSSTPGALLDEYGYEFSETDKITPALDAHISDNSHIAIIRIEEKNETISEEIPYQSTERENEDLPEGEINVVQEGKTGEKQIVYKIKYEDGVEVSREKISEDIVIASVDRITEIGTKKPEPKEEPKPEPAEEPKEAESKPEPVAEPKKEEPKPEPIPEPKKEEPKPEPIPEPKKEESKTESSTPVLASAEPKSVPAANTIQTSRNGNLAYSRVITLNATAYDASTCGKSPSHPLYGITATGAKATYGIVAVDPKVIPLGTRLYIETTDGSFIYGTAVAADTGGAIKGNRIDLCFNSRKEARNFGRRQVKVYILK